MECIDGSWQHINIKMKWNWCNSLYCKFCLKEKTGRKRRIMKTAFSFSLKSLRDIKMNGESCCLFWHIVKVSASFQIRIWGKYIKQWDFKNKHTKPFTSRRTGSQRAVHTCNKDAVSVQNALLKCFPSEFKNHFELVTS